MIKFVKGDIFLTDCMAIGHGCNTQGFMGAGIALSVKQNHALAFNQYKKACQSGLFKPGVVQTVKCPTKIIVNMATQAKIRRHDGSGGARERWIRKCLENVRDNYKSRGYDSIAFPKVGCSLGGLNWKNIRPLFQEIFSDSELKVVIYEEYIDGKKACEI